MTSFTFWPSYSRYKGFRDQRFYRSLYRCGGEEKRKSVCTPRK